MIKYKIFYDLFSTKYLAEACNGFQNDPRLIRIARRSTVSLNDVSSNLFKDTEFHNFKEILRIMLCKHFKEARVKYEKNRKNV